MSVNSPCSGVAGDVDNGVAGDVDGADDGDTERDAADFMCMARGFVP
jgi:hypothetical protein